MQVHTTEPNSSESPYTATVTMVAPSVNRTNASGLFCFALVMPFGYEPELLALQHRKRTGIFGCDEHAAFSNRSLGSAPGLVTGLLAADLECERGGEMRTQLNLDVFEAVWAQVIHDGRYKEYGWTVKVDVDSVFLPSRLRLLLANHSGAEDHPHGMYFNNCRFGMHGPIEVFSRAAVGALGSGWEQCRRHYHQLCAGRCWWGEDLFVDQCLSEVLGVRRSFDASLLREERCDPPKHWESCHEHDVVAFHPFKTANAYKRCLTNAAEDSAVFFK